MRNDIINPAIIQHCAVECVNEKKCEFKAQREGGTMMASFSHYDAEGNLHVRDPNWTNWRIKCNYCQREFLLSAKGDFGDETEVQIIWK